MFVVVMGLNKEKGVRNVIVFLYVNKKMSKFGIFIIYYLFFVICINNVWKVFFFFCLLNIIRKYFLVKVCNNILYNRLLLYCSI